MSKTVFVVSAAKREKGFRLDIDHVRRWWAGRKDTPLPQAHRRYYPSPCPTLPQSACVYLCIRPSNLRHHRLIIPIFPCHFHFQTPFNP